MKWSVVQCSLAFVIFVPAVVAQSRVPVEGWQKGSVIRHPEKFSGLWEAEARHRIFGMQIVLTTRARNSGKPAGRVIQVCDEAKIEVFEQMGPMRAEGEGTWFDANSPGVAWTGNHLKIDSAGAAGPEIALDLRFNPESETWTGRFHRDSLDEVVTLHRPRAANGVAKSRFVGTWKRAGVVNTCLHIAEGAGGELHAWSDDVVAPEAASSRKGAPRPRETTETYGFAAQVQVQTAHNILVRLKAFSRVCCTNAGGVLSQDGTRIRSNLQTENSRNPGSEDWLRVRGDSCLAEEP